MGMFLMNSPATTLDTLTRLIEQRTGLNVYAQFRNELQPLLEQLAGGDLVWLLKHLQATSETDPQWQALINTLTIGETYFMRDKEHFRLLRTRILPQIIMEKRQQKRLELTIWCAGCATGEEPYSVAITLQEFLPDVAKWKINLIGTDINQRAIETARQALYRKWSFRHTEPGFEKRYFEAAEQGAQLKPDIQKMVTFKRANVLDTPPVAHCDIIFCRNVLLYLSKDSIRQVENSVFDALANGGWFILGHAEALRYQRERWLLHIFPGTPIYQKPITTPTIAKLSAAPPKPIIHDPIENAESFIVSDPDSSPKEAYLAAVEAIQHDNYPAAERYLVEVLAQQPNHARAHTLLAFIFAGRQAYPEAHAHLDKAMKNEPLLADAHYIRGLLHLEQKENAEAQEVLRAALYCNRQHIMAADLLGTLRAQDGDLPDAYRLWRNARKAISALAPHAFVSDFSDMTAAKLDILLAHRLDEP